MRVSDGQTLGAVTLLLISLGVYATQFLSERYPVRVGPDSRSARGSDAAAVGVADGAANVPTPSETVFRDSVKAQTGAMTAARRLALGLRIDINRASREELVLVPGIGDKTAQRIIQLRKQKGAFRDISELKAMPGIKEKRLDHLRKYLSTEER